MTLCSKCQYWSGECCITSLHDSGVFCHTAVKIQSGMYLKSVFSWRNILFVKNDDKRGFVETYHKNYWNDPSFWKYCISNWWWNLGLPVQSSGKKNAMRPIKNTESPRRINPIVWQWNIKVMLTCSSGIKLICITNLSFQTNHPRFVKVYDSKFFKKVHIFGQITRLRTFGQKPNTAHPRFSPDFVPCDFVVF